MGPASGIGDVPAVACRDADAGRMRLGDSGSAHASVIRTRARTMRRWLR